MKNLVAVGGAAVVGALIALALTRVPAPRIKIPVKGTDYDLGDIYVSKSAANQIEWNLEDAAATPVVKIPDWVSSPPNPNPPPPSPSPGPAVPYKSPTVRKGQALSGALNSAVTEKENTPYTIKVGTKTYFGHIIIQK